jgi:ankyrin repeat protein
LRNLLGPEPKAIAKGVTRELDEPLLNDAIEHPATLRALLELGLDPNEIGASGRTPLMAAARLDLVEAARILLAHGATLDIRAKDAVAQTDSTGDPLCMIGDQAAGDTPGRTALSYAAELGSPDMVRLLLDHGADPANRDRAGRRPADYVSRPIRRNRRDAEMTKMRPQPGKNRSRCRRASGNWVCAAAAFSRMRLMRSAGKASWTRAVSQICHGWLSRHRRFWTK